MGALARPLLPVRDNGAQAIRIRVRVARTYPLTDVAQAHRDGQAGHSAGKLILVP